MQPLGVGADIGELQGEIDAPRWAVGLFQGHDLLAEQETRVGRQLDPGTGAEAERGPVHDHRLAGVQFKD